MKLSTKGRYACRAMLELALNYKKKPILLREIAKNQEISEKYLDRILSSLKSSGLIKSTRGAQGGYSLVKPPSKIKLNEIIQSLEGSLAPVECVDDPKLCHRSDICATKDVWLQLKEVMIKTLESITLQDLLERSNKKYVEKTEKSLMYNI